MNTYIRNILVYALLLILQVVIFNKFTLGGVATPHVFLIFLLMLPLNLNFAVTILIAFFSGLLVDLFSSNMLIGFHAFSCVLMMALRDWWITIVTTRISFRGNEDVFLTSQPIQWYLNYLTPLILIHHIAFYMLEAFSFDNFWMTLLKISTSTIYSLFFCVIFMILVYSKTARR